MQLDFPQMYGPPQDCKGKVEGEESLRQCVRPVCGDVSPAKMRYAAEASSVRQSFAETVIPFLSSSPMFQTINDTRRQNQVALPIGERPCLNKTHQ